LRRRCDYPLTAPGVVQRVYSDLAVMDLAGGRLVVREAVPGLGPEDFARWTEAGFVFADDCRELTAPDL
jgi:acyl CoA:acetate/3-ketoacid CoA transferase beta subunit